MANRKNNDPHQAIQWPTGKTMIHTRQYNGQQEKQLSTPDNTMANRKNNDPHQTIQWPTGKTMIHTRQYNGQQEKQ
jgi:hypothetical protein